jgi:hypothetical protein
VLSSQVIRYRRERWLTPDGGEIIAPLPPYLVSKAGRRRLPDDEGYAGACCRMRSGSQGTALASGILRRAPR